MKSCLKCMHWGVCEYWTRDYGPPHKNPFPLHLDDEDKVDMCGFYKPTSEYKLEIVREFVLKHKEMMKMFLDDDNEFIMKWCEYEVNTDSLMVE